MTCNNCKYFAPNSIRPKSEAGRCLYVVTWPDIPEVLRHWTPPLAIDRGCWPDDGDGCKCFKQKGAA